MSAPTQSGSPYPWNERKKFVDTRRMLASLMKVTTVLSIVGTVLSPVSVIASMWASFGFRRHNDSWSRRGLTIGAIGIVGCVVLVVAPSLIVSAFVRLGDAISARDTYALGGAYALLALALLPAALILQSIHALVSSAHTEKDSEAFLGQQIPTRAMVRRQRRNAAQLASGADPKGSGMVRFGTVENDVLPWRQSRYGMVVERPIEKLGHGVFIGSNGMGKTKAAESFAHYLLTAGAGVIYLDFKAAVSTRDGLMQVAQEADVPHYSLDIGFGSKDTTWYDLFAWGGSPSDMASVLMDSFQFPEGAGGSQHYRNIAESYLPLQITAAQEVGLRDGEGMFDFLLDTVSPTKLRQRIEPLRNSDDPAKRDVHQRLHDASQGLQANDLQGLRSEITKVVNAAGARLKPNAANPHPLSMREVMDNGGLIYIGIAGNVNDVIVKVLGSYLFRELGVHIGERGRQDTQALRDVVVIPDEASRMEERSVLLNPLYATAREARVFIWPAFQSFASWHATTKQEMATNTMNFMVFAVPDMETAQVLSDTLGYIPALTVASREETRLRRFRRQSIGTSGDSQVSIVMRPFLRPGVELTNVPQYHAYMWFKGRSAVPRGRWVGKGRVRKADIHADAPLVRLIPYEAVLEHQPGTTAVTAAPQIGAAGEVVVLGEGTRMPQDTPVPAESAGGGAVDDGGPDGHRDASSGATQWIVQPTDADGDSEVMPIRGRASGDAAPALPSFARRRASSVADTQQALAASAGTGAPSSAGSHAAPSAPVPQPAADSWDDLAYPSSSSQSPSVASHATDDGPVSSEPWWDDEPSPEEGAAAVSDGARVVERDPADDGQRGGVGAPADAERAPKRGGSTKASRDDDQWIV